jgi:ParB family chromosome partitioning protein
MARKKRPPIDLEQTPQPRKADLSQLFSNDSDVEMAAGMLLRAIRLEAIQPDPTQPRQTFSDESLQELSQSIAQDGIIQPIEVTQVDDGRYLIVHGERRWRAAQIAGLERIPALVRRRDYDDVTRFVRQLVENIQREDLNDMDRAYAIFKLREMLQQDRQQRGEKKKVSWAEVARRLGYSRQRIHQLTKLQELAEDIQEDVRAGRMSERDTRIYQGLKPSQQRALHAARVREEISENEARQVARMLRADPERTYFQAIQDLRQPFPDLIESDKRPERPVEPRSMGPLERSPEGDRVNNIQRLTWIRTHLARVQWQALSVEEQRETQRLLQLIARDVDSLLRSLETDIF